MVVTSLHQGSVILRSVSKPVVMPDDLAIRIEDLSIKYKINVDTKRTLKNAIMRASKGEKVRTRTIEAVKHLTIDVPHGSVLGIVGANGAGKSTFRRQFLDSLSDFTILNIDDEYEPLLKKAGLPLDFRQFKSSEELSAAGSAMAQAQKIHRAKYEKSKLEERKEEAVIIIDI